MQAPQSTVDPAEIEKFQAMAAEWWDENGKFKPLHMLNPCRLDYITSQIAGEFDRDLKSPEPFRGLRILDIGCGGGLLSEPMARLGAEVVGADAAGRSLAEFGANLGNEVVVVRHCSLLNGPRARVLVNSNADCVRTTRDLLPGPAHRVDHGCVRIPRRSSPSLYINLFQEFV